MAANGAAAARSAGRLDSRQGRPRRSMAAYDSFRHLLFRLNPETAHDLTIGMLRPFREPKPVEHHPDLSVTLAGLTFPTPLGLAAGFDKDAKAPGNMLGFGFGSVEVGTVTPRAQPGNDAPRLFRLVEDEAIINRFGFNSDGHHAVRARLAKRARKPGIVGVNLGANKDSEDKIEDYVLGVRCLSEFASYLTINVSSPNTAGLRDLQKENYLPRLIERVISERDRIGGPPVFLKVAPDLEHNEVRQIASCALAGRIDALIVSNTTVSRPPSLRSPNARETGGLSGAPLKPLALKALRAFRAEVGSRLPLIGVGGISSAHDAYERIKAGATLVQLYTALPYQGPAIVMRINKGLIRLLHDDGFTSIEQAIGIEAVGNEANVAA